MSLNNFREKADVVTGLYMDLLKHEGKHNSIYAPSHHIFSLTRCSNHLSMASNCRACHVCD